MEKLKAFLLKYSLNKFFNKGLNTVSLPERAFVHNTFLSMGILDGKDALSLKLIGTLMKEKALLFSEYFLRKISLPPLNKTETGAGERWRRRAEFLRDKEAAKNVLDIGEAEVGSSSLVAASSCSL